MMSRSESDLGSVAHIQLFADTLRRACEDSDWCAGGAVRYCKKFCSMYELDGVDAVIALWAVMFENVRGCRPTTRHIFEIYRELEPTRTMHRQERSPDECELPLFLKTSEVAEILRISKSSIYQSAAGGEIPGAIKIGGTHRFRRDALLTWFDDMKRKSLLG